MLWTFFVARANHINLPLTAVLAMGIAVWILYAADRLLDTRILRADASTRGIEEVSEEAQMSQVFLISKAAQAAGLEPRHYFHRRHRHAFRMALVAASIALAVLLPKILPASLRLYLILGTSLLAYFLMIHVDRFSTYRKSLFLPKELAVGVFFSAATFIPTIARNSELRLALTPGAALLATVCSVNCLFIYAWEHPVAVVHIDLGTSMFLRILPHLATSVVITGLVLSIISRTLPWPIPIACVGAVLSLLLLHRNRNQFPPTTLRAAADLCLLTPLFLLHFS